jgi:uncharacterized membrane protein YfcA
MKSEVHLATTGAALSQLSALVNPAFLIFTLFPAVVGAAMHTINRARKKELKGWDIFTALVAAIMIGVFGGPWVAKLAPQSETALPLMCYLSAFYSQTFLEWAKRMADRLSAGDPGGKK